MYSISITRRPIHGIRSSPREKLQHSIRTKLSELQNWTRYICPVYTRVQKIVAENRALNISICTKKPSELQNLYKGSACVLNLCLACKDM